MGLLGCLIQVFTDTRRVQFIIFAENCCFFNITFSFSGITVFSFSVKHACVIFITLSLYMCIALLETETYILGVLQDLRIRVDLAPYSTVLSFKDPVTLCNQFHPEIHLEIFLAYGIHLFPPQTLIFNMLPNYEGQEVMTQVSSDRQLETQGVGVGRQGSSIRYIYPHKLPSK